MALNDSIIVILIGGGALLIGLLTGAGLALMLAGREPEAARRANLREALRIWLRQDGGLAFEVDGDVYQSVDEMTVTQYKRLLALLDNLGEWLNVREISSQKPVGAAPSIRVSENLAAPPMKINEPRPVPSFYSKTEKAEAAREKENAVKPVNLSMAQSFLRMLRPKSRDVDSAPLSIVVQVNEILQRKLDDSGLQGLGIGLVELPDGAILVRVGDHSYDGVAAVPDEDVRALIQACVVEWEANAAGQQ